MTIRTVRRKDNGSDCQEGSMIIGILILIIVGLMGVFSIQNTTTVSVSFLQWKFETSLTILIFVAVLLGVVVEQLVRQWGARRNAKIDKPQDTR
jgi:uncharacterized integral membrane protein